MIISQYEPWVTSHGLNYKHIGGEQTHMNGRSRVLIDAATLGSPTALMQLSVEHKMFSPGFFRESLGKVSSFINRLLYVLLRQTTFQFRTWFDDLLRECWEACQDGEPRSRHPLSMC
jgi:sterol 3beta-glucosyltransferase